MKTRRFSIPKGLRNLWSQSSDILYHNLPGIVFRVSIPLSVMQSFFRDLYFIPSWMILATALTNSSLFYTCSGKSCIAGYLFPLFQLRLYSLVASPKVQAVEKDGFEQGGHLYSSSASSAMYLFEEVVTHEVRILIQ